MHEYFKKKTVILEKSYGDNSIFECSCIRNAWKALENAIATSHRHNKNVETTKTCGPPPQDTLGKHTCPVCKPGTAWDYTKHVVKCANYFEALEETGCPASACPCRSTNTAPEPENKTEEELGTNTSMDLALTPAKKPGMMTEGENGAEVHTSLTSRNNKSNCEHLLSHRSDPVETSVN